jgi:dephospho-CoA kinase
MAPYLIGLTGRIGAGKSTAASELSALGAEIISGDELGKQVVETSSALLAQIRVRFGSSVFDGQGRLLRRKLGQAVFSNVEDSRWLTQLTFPGIYALWKDAVAHSAHSVMVFDAALIFEWGIEKDFDLLVTVRADPVLVSKRVIMERMWSSSEVDQRLSAQVQPDVKESGSHIVLENNGSLEELRSRIRQVWNERIVPEIQTRR